MFEKSRRALALAALALAAPALAGCTALGSDDAEGARIGAGTAQVSLASIKAQRPNIFMVTVDDMTASDLAYMPNVRRMIGDKGVQLDNGIAPTPICVPSRASVLTGQYAHNHNALGITGRFGGVTSMDERDTLPVWLSRAGYDTYFVGKYLNGYGKGKPGSVGAPKHVPDGWTGWEGSLDPATYDANRSLMNRNGKVVSEKGFNSDAFARRAAKVLSAPQRKVRPWYMWLNFVAPHFSGPREADDPTPFSGKQRMLVRTPAVAPRDRNTFSRLKLEQKPSMLRSDKSKYVLGTRDKWSARGKRALIELRQQRVESLQAVDRAVGSHVRLLERKGMADNTLMVFTSDNGFLVGEHSLKGKTWFYDESLEVPLVMRGPGIPQGSHNATIVTTADLPVMFAGLAGVTPPSDVDGVDVMDALRTGETVDRVVPVAAWGDHVMADRPLYTGIRVGERWTYARLRNGREEMYDLTGDPYQLRNLARSSAHSGVLATLRTLNRTMAECRTDGCDVEVPSGL